MLVNSFNLSQSFNYTHYLFYTKTVQNRDQLFLYTDPYVITRAKWPRWSLLSSLSCTVKIKHPRHTPPPCCLIFSLGVLVYIWLRAIGPKIAASHPVDIFRDILIILDSVLQTRLAAGRNWVSFFSIVIIKTWRQVSETRLGPGIDYS